MSLSLSNAPATAAPAPLPSIRLHGALIRARGIVASGLPLLVVLVVILGTWQLLASRPGSSLPPPTTVWETSYELIADPFLTAGGWTRGCSGTCMHH